MAGKYTLLDSGLGMKLEDFGGVVLARPCAQALWQPHLPGSTWQRADATFSREGKNQWTYRSKVPDSWNVILGGIICKLSLTDFGHVGLFPEHSFFGEEMTLQIQKCQHPPKILNLFAYSGFASMVAAKAGGSVCHLDASKGMIAWAKENAALNGLEKAPIRWIIDDAVKFLRREVKRGVLYDGILLDPPSFGRGAQGEVFKLEQALPELLSLCRSLLSQDPLFVIFSSHTAGISPMACHHLIGQMMGTLPGRLDSGEMKISPLSGFDLPSGSFARWRRS